MQQNRVTNRVTKPASSVPSPVPAVPAPDVEVESFSRSPGQHEELIDRVRNGFKETLRVLDEVSKQHQDVHVNVHLDTSVQKEILEVVKEIRSDVKVLLEKPTGDSGASAEKLREFFDPITAHLREVADKFTPTGSTVAKKKKESTK